MSMQVVMFAKYVSDRQDTLALAEDHLLSARASTALHPGDEYVVGA